MAQIESHYNSFLENYDKGMNEILKEASQGFFERINVDKELIIGADQGISGKKLAQINVVEKDKDSYSKMIATGKILADIANDLYHSEIPEIKKSGINIINNYFEVARNTKDEELMNTGVAISKNIKK